MSSTPAHFLTHLATHAERQPDKTALRVSSDGGGADDFDERSYAQLYARVLGLSQKLRALVAERASVPALAPGVPSHETNPSEVWRLPLPDAPAVAERASVPALPSGVPSHETNPSEVWRLPPCGERALILMPQGVFILWGL